MIVIINFCIKSISRKILPIGYTFRVDYDIWTTRRDPKSPAARLKVHFANWRHTPCYPCLMTTSRLISLIIFGLQTSFRCVEISWDIWRPSHAVQSFRLISSKLCQNSTPLSLKKGCGIGVLKSSMDSTRVAAANYRQKATFCLFLLKLR